VDNDTKETFSWNPLYTNIQNIVCPRKRLGTELNAQKLPRKKKRTKKKEEKNKRTRNTSEIGLTTRRKI